MSYISKKFIRSRFKDKDIQINEGAIEELDILLRRIVEFISYNAFDRRLKRVTKEKLPQILGKYNEGGIQ
tara:strand:- start:6398 stop:6607 length:210 start_codon:yes stop_codon:yes gene_type:complete